MKKLLILFTLTLLSVATTLGQDFYSKYIKEAGAAYSRKDYLTALERYDLAWEFARTEPQKNVTNSGKKKCRNAIRQQNHELQNALNKAKKALKQAEIEREKAQKLAEAFMPDSIICGRWRIYDGER